jgi:molybdopterin synthase catalytic subunit
MTVAFLTTDPIDLLPLLAAVQSPARGGIASFVGVVRDHHGDRGVLRLQYSAYGPMVEAECVRIVAEAESRWPVSIALRHRVGILEVGETAIAVVAGSGHRAAAFDACRYVIEEVKRRLPIWKQEFYVDGTHEWVDPTETGRSVPAESA